jgi:hypothetical protein
LKNATSRLLILALLVLLGGCAERQDANLPSNVLAYLGRVPARGVANDVAYANGLAYVADEPFGISIYDLTDPASPVLVDSMALPFPEVKLVSIDSSGHVLAVENSSLRLFDLQTGEYIMDVGSSQNSEVELVYDGENLKVYLSDRGYTDGFRYQVFPDTSSSDTLKFGALSYTSGYTTFDPNKILYGFARITNDRVFVTEDLYGVLLLDLGASNPAAILGEFNAPGLTRDAAASGNLLCLASGYEGLLIWDITDPINPSSLGQLIITNATDIEYVEISGQRAYLLDINDGAFAVDISNPANPVLVGQLPTSDPNNFCLAGDLILIADKDMGLVVGQILY